MEDLSVEKGRRKEMKKVSNLIGTIALAFVAFFAVNTYAEAATVAKVDSAEYSDLATAVSNADGKTVVLTDNVELPSTLTISTNSSLTIDLNGHELKGPSSGYAIENKGNLTIQDTGSEKKSITCQATVSCISNTDSGVMVVDGVTVKYAGEYAGIINHAATSTLTVKNSVIDVTTNSSAIQNYGNATVTGTTINLPKSGSVGVMNYGTATIKDTKIAGPSFGSAVFGIESFANNTFNNSKTTVEDVTMTGQTNVKANQENGQGATELIINGLKAKQIQVGEGATVEPDAATFEKIVKQAKTAINGAKIVVPDDYEGEVPNISGVKYVNNKGTEIVYVTFNGVRYERAKGSTWAGPNDLSAALSAERGPEDRKDKTFGGFYYIDENGEEQVATKNTQWNYNAEVYIKWTVTLNFNGVEYTLMLGKNGAPAKIGDAVDAEGNTLANAMDAMGEDAKFFIYGVDPAGNGTYVDADSEINSNIEPVNGIFVRADYSELDKLLEQYEDFKPNADMYLEDRWKALEDAVNAASNPFVTSQWQSTVNQWVSDIQNAFTGLLEKPADYTEVNKSVAEGNAVDRTLYTKESLDALDTALAAVKEGYKISQQSEVNSWKTAIDAAIAGLVYKSADYTAVDAALAKVPEDPTPYTDESWAALQAAINAVVRGKNITEQTTVDGYAKAIEDAIAALEEKVVLDTTELEGAKDIAETLTEESYGSYENWGALQTAIENANKEMTTQDEVDAATKALQDAILAILNEEIAGIDKTAYTEDSWKTLEEAQTFANSAEEGRNAAISAVIGAIDNLEVAPVKPEQKPANPDTLDNAISYVVMMIMAVVAMVIGVVARREANER